MHLTGSQSKIGLTVIAWVLLSITVSHYGVAQQVIETEDNERLSQSGRDWDIPALVRHFERQQKKLDSLSLRVRRAAIIDDNLTVLATNLFRLPIRAGVDESILVSQGDRRYARTLELDYPASNRKDDQTAESRIYADQAHSCSGRRVLGRHRNLETGEYEYTDASAHDVKDCFLQHSFVRNIGWAKPDPTASTSSKQTEELWCLTRLLGRGTYSIDGTETFENTNCLKIVGRFAIDRSIDENEPVLHSFDDTMWLDIEHGMALRGRDIRCTDYIIEIRNQRFKELAGDVWTPQDSQMRVRNVDSTDLADALCCESLVLQYAHTQKVPEGLFTIALRPLKMTRLPGKEIAYHYVDKWSEFKNFITKESWNRPGAGWRFEVRDRTTKLSLLKIDNGEFHLIYMPKLKRVLISASKQIEALSDLRAFDSPPLVHLNECIQASESLTALIMKEDVDLDGQNAIKITAIYPADPDWPANAGLQPLEWPIHEFNPKIIQDIKEMNFRARTTWFHPKHQFPMKRECGCKAPKHRYTVEYPNDPSSISLDLFEFKIPKGVTVDAESPELRALLRNEEG